VTISHHLDDATLMSFAAGTLAQSLSAVAEAHIELCAQCRTELRKADALAGHVLAQESEVEISADLKSKVMAQLDTATLHRFPQAQAKPQSGGLPRSLTQWTGLKNLDEIKWQRSAPGIEVAKLAKPKGEPGFFGLLRIQPGKAVPDHGHGGTELTLILSGAYHDELGRFQRGDIADLDESISHKPVAEGSEPCICLVANDAPTAFRSWAARLMQPMIGI